MEENKTPMSCIDCHVINCRRGEEGKYPDFCLTTNVPEEVQERAMALLKEPENPEEHKEDYGYADPFGGDIELDIEIPDENPDITQDGQTASDETILDETGSENISGETVTGGSTPSADAPDGEDSASADTNNTEPAPETTDAAEGEDT